MDIFTNSYDPGSILNFLVQSGTISSLDDVAEAMNRNRIKQIIAAHPVPISQGADGRWRTYVKDDNGKRRQIAKSTYEKLEAALIDFYVGRHAKPVKDVISIESLYPNWLKYKKLHNASPTYIMRLESNWRNYYEGTDIVKQPISQLNKLTLDIWCHELIEKTNRSKKEYYNASCILRQILDYAVDAELIPENPMKKVHIDGRMVFAPKKKPVSETQVFSKEEVEALYKVAWKWFDEERMTIHKLAPLAVMFQFETGVRVGELLSLRYDDVDGDELHVQRMYRYETKEVVDYIKGHNAERFTLLTSRAKHLIATAQQYQKDHGLKSDGYIFSVNSEPLPYLPIKDLYTRFCEEIDTVAKSSHKTRKTYISALIDGGVNINTIREMVGHADERTTFGNYCYDRTEKSERVKLIEKALSS
ncbi:MAG: tyrosine-type recombinase/integrase [Firmicutes bacterium]|nr:tyrosine-type recombinase/integrase [Bacillota bacterium]